MNSVKNGKHPDSIEVSKEALDKITGWTRVKQMYRLAPDGEFSPQVQMIEQIMPLSLASGGIIGGYQNVIRRIPEIKKQMRLKPFISRHTATSYYTDKIIMAGVKGFLSLGIRTSVFATTLSTVFFTIITYNSNAAPFLVISSSAIAGALYRLPRGPKPMVNGALLGISYATFYTLMFSVPIYLTGSTWKSFMDHVIEREKQDTALVAESYQKKGFYSRKL